MQTALVTGATKGIGKAVAIALTRRGVRVYATGRDELALSQLKDQTGAFGSAWDLSVASAPEALYRDAVEVLGGAPRILVNNAGFNSRKSPIAEVTAEDLDAQYAVNLRAPALLCALALPDMARNVAAGQTPRPHIVNVISTVVHHGIETMGVYSAMKQGLFGWTRVLIKEARDQGVKVTALHPGGTDTSFRSAARPEYMRPDSVAAMVEHVLFAPDDVVVHELTFRPLAESNF